MLKLNSQAHSVPLSANVIRRKYVLYYIHGTKGDRVFVRPVTVLYLTAPVDAKGDYIRPSKEDGMPPRPRRRLRMSPCHKPLGEENNTQLKVGSWKESGDVVTLYCKPAAPCLRYWRSRLNVVAE